MNLSLTIKQSWIDRGRKIVNRFTPEQWIAGIALVLAILASFDSFHHGWIIAYGDAESHLNIAKRVIDSLTPGFAQLGGIWLPLPHLLLVPFVSINFLWRTGLAGSMVSGICYIVSSIFLYKTAYLITKHKGASFICALVFMLNPNILYLQSTPLSELTLLVFFTLSSYYFIKYLEDQKNLLSLLLAGLFGFLAALSRYDGWFLIGMQAGVLALVNLPWRKIPRNVWQLKEYWDSKRFQVMEGKVIMFVTLTFFAIGLWLLWGWLILDDPFYFTDSAFSAKAQQMAWAARNELPAKGHALVALLYYGVTTMSNAGVFMFALAIVGLVLYLRGNRDKNRYMVALILLAPFLFNVISLYIGQSVIFIPSLTPYTFDWTLFNVRYGAMMIPTVAFLCSYVYYKSQTGGKLLILGLILAQIGLYVVGYSTVITLQDGVMGLSSETYKPPIAQNFIDANYDGGLVLQDDFARTISIIRSPIPMQDDIYIGNKPYYDESLKAPEKYATWIVMQKDDAIWDALYANQATQGRLYKYFNKVYTSPTVLIFKRNPAVPESD